MIKLHTCFLSDGITIHLRMAIKCTHYILQHHMTQKYIHTQCIHFTHMETTWNLTQCSVWGMGGGGDEQSHGNALHDHLLSLLSCI